MSIIAAIIVALQTILGMSPNDAATKANDIYSDGKYKVDEKGSIYVSDADVVVTDSITL